MSVTFTFMCLVTVTAVTSPFAAFSLRQLGVEKNVALHASESRDLILCWIVQIRTSMGVNRDTAGLDNGSGQAGSRECSRFVEVDGKQPVQNSDCLNEQSYMTKHISALSKEIGLHVLHTFGHFHDHFLLCYLNASEKSNGIPIRDPRSTKSKSETLSLIHHQHSHLRSTDRVLFERQRAEIEDRLNRHNEVLWFVSEYVHRHHSRSIPAPELDLKTRQKRFRSLTRTTEDGAVHGRYYPADTDIQGQQEEKQQRDVKFHIEHSSYQNTSVLSEAYHIRKSLSRNSDSAIKGVDSKRSVEKSGSLENNFPNVDITYSQGNVMDDISVEGVRRNQGVPKNSSHSMSKRASNVAFNDPAYPRQWHLLNRLRLGMDINVTGVWQHNVTGRGVTVAVVDDGLEWKNVDIEANYNYKGSWDMNNDDPDPTPGASKVTNHHGTRCAGEIAAVANNRVCGVGVAYEAQISGLKVLDGLMTDSLEAEAFNKNMDVNDIYSCSWGPEDDGRTVDGPHLMAAKAMKYGVDYGRQGYGSIYVLASGNGGENLDNCNFDGYANSIYTVTVGAVDEEGNMPYYAEECASMLGVTFSSGTLNKRDIVTTDWTLMEGKGCTDSHTGTSAAAPLAAAMIALMLQSRPCLTWRDVQYIIILTARKVDRENAHSQNNGAGLSHSHKHGFGLLDSWRLVNAARVWKMVPWMTSHSHAESNLELWIPKGEQDSLRVDHVVSERDIQGFSLFILENVQLTVSISHPCRGSLSVKLVSPLGTVSVLAAPRPKDNSSDGFNDWTFTSVRCWGEAPTGNWTFYVTDHDNNLFEQGKVTKWRLTLFGTSMTQEEFSERQRDVESAMSGEFLGAPALPCPPAPKSDSMSFHPLSEKTLKILILAGAFCLIMAIYETFEYLLCYNEEKKEVSRNIRLTHRAQMLAGGLGNNEDGCYFLANGESLSGRGGTANGVVNDGNADDDDEEDDVFDASETSQLLGVERGSWNSRDSGVGVPEEIPLSTFSIERCESKDVDYFPCQFDEPTSESLQADRGKESNEGSLALAEVFH